MSESAETSTINVESECNNNKYEAIPTENEQDQKNTSEDRADSTYNPPPSSAQSRQAEPHRTRSTTLQMASTNEFLERNDRRIEWSDYTEILKSLQIRRDSWPKFDKLVRGFLHNQLYSRLFKSKPGTSYTPEVWANIEGPNTNHEICRMLAEGFFSNHGQKLYDPNCMGKSKRRGVAKRSVTVTSWLQEGATLTYKDDGEVILNLLYDYFVKLRFMCMTWDSQDAIEEAADEYVDRKIAEGRDDEIITDFINEVRAKVWKAPRVKRGGENQPLTDFGGPALPEDEDELTEEENEIFYDSDATIDDPDLEG